METPILCLCNEGYIEVKSDWEGFYGGAYCATCGLMYNISVIVEKLKDDHHYIVDCYGRLKSPQDQSEETT